MIKKLESVNVIINVAKITKINKMHQFLTQINMFTRNYYDITNTVLLYNKQNNTKVTDVTIKLWLLVLT